MIVQIIWMEPSIIFNKKLSTLKIKTKISEINFAITISITIITQRRQTTTFMDKFRTIVTQTNMELSREVTKKKKLNLLKK